MGFISINQLNGDGAVIINVSKITTIKVPQNGNYVDVITYLGEGAGNYGQLRCIAQVPGSLGRDTQERWNDAIIRAQSTDVVVIVPLSGQDIKTIQIDPAP
jgi:hypothetical protein